MQNYTSLTKSQTSPMFSFHLNGFWLHVRMSGNIGTDQHGDRWMLRGDRLYSEHGYHVIDIAPRYKDENEEIDMMIEDRIDEREFSNEIFEREEGL